MEKFQKRQTFRKSLDIAAQIFHICEIPNVSLGVATTGSRAILLATTIATLAPDGEFPPPMVNTIFLSRGESFLVNCVIFTTAAANSFLCRIFRLVLLVDLCLLRENFGTSL